MSYAEDDKAEKVVAARLIAAGLRSVANGVIELDIRNGAPAAWLTTDDGIVYGIVEVACDEQGEPYESSPVYTVLDGDGCPVERYCGIDGVRLASIDEAVGAVSRLVAAERR